MLKLMHPFNQKQGLLIEKAQKTFLLLGMTLLILGSVGGNAFADKVSAEAPEFKKIEGGLYRDIFDENVYHEFTSYLHLERLYSRVTGKKNRAKNVNVFDEVPDSTFFTNRHGKNRLSPEALKAGYRENDGIEASGNLTVYKGKFEGVRPGFFVQDSKGNRYLFKFDSIDSFERETSAEVIASRFYYAIGYFVPQYDIAVFAPEKLVPSEDAQIYDDTGFLKPLTKERLEEYVLFLPQDAKGNYRASSSKILEGENKGHFSFHGKRKNDPLDPVNHKDRREIRALQVFASWLNNYDVRESNTLDILESINGEKRLRHYLIDFNATLGGGAEYPMFTHEHMIDYGQALKAFASFGLWEKPWQKRWREAGQQINQSAAVGYFDNRYFDPEAFKTQLPYYAFKDLTRADGYWAAKIIMSFTDEDIQTLVKSGQLSDPKDESYIAKTLIERRDLIGRYWFEQANPLDFFDLKNNTLAFEDLGVTHGFYPQGSRYRLDVMGRKGKKAKKIDSVEIEETSLDISKWLSDNEEVHFLIRTLRPGSEKWSPYVLVKVGRQGVLSIIHQD